MWINYLRTNKAFREEYWKSREEMGERKSDTSSFVPNVD